MKPSPTGGWREIAKLGLELLVEELAGLTSVSEQCSGGTCETCPGIFYREDFPGKSIFCVHHCHRKMNHDASFG
jgi:hypothetical protein